MTEMHLVVRQLRELARELDVAVAKLAELDQVRIKAEGDYKVAEARAFQSAEGSIEARKREATIMCDQLWRTWGLAESAVNVQKAHIKAVHTRIDLGRTYQSTIRTEMTLAGTGGAP